MITCTFSHRLMLCVARGSAVLVRSANTMHGVNPGPNVSPLSAKRAPAARRAPTTTNATATRVSARTAATPTAEPPAALIATTPATVPQVAAPRPDSTTFRARATLTKRTGLFAAATTSALPTHAAGPTAATSTAEPPAAPTATAPVAAPPATRPGFIWPVAMHPSAQWNTLPDSLADVTTA